MLIKILIIKKTMTPAKAPCPADFAFSGSVSFHTKYSIRPTKGKKKPKAVKAPEGLSSVLLPGFR